MLDAHAHLDKYDADQIDQVLAAIERESILTLSVSVDPSSFLRAEAIAARSMLVIPSFGIHPEHAPLFVGSLDQIVHCVGAEQDALDLMTSFGIDRAIIHWYSGPVDVLADMIAAGYWFTIGVEVLHSEHIRRIARLVPAGQLLTETDNPGGKLWLTGEPGQPSHLRGIVNELARLREVPTPVLSDLIRRNFLRLIEQDDHLAPWRPLLADSG
jgi:TatD DNase family protein